MSQPDEYSLSDALRPDLIARFNVSSITGPAPLKIQFSDNSIGNIIKRKWNFGDSSPITLLIKNPIHNFTTPGIYNVTLTVSDTNKHTATSVIEINVLKVEETKYVRKEARNLPPVTGENFGTRSTKKSKNVEITKSASLKKDIISKSIVETIPDFNPSIQIDNKEDNTSNIRPRGPQILTVISHSVPAQKPILPKKTMGPNQISPVLKKTFKPGFSF